MYGEKIMSQSKVHEWMTMNCQRIDTPCSRQPATSWSEDTVKQAKDVTHFFHCQAVEMIAEV
jgi:hypothetical protein